MASLNELKDQVDLHDLAQWLGLERPENTGNYRSPHRNDSNPSLSIYDNGRRWKDFGGDESAYGDCFDLVKYVENIPEHDMPKAIARIRDYLGLPAQDNSDVQMSMHPKTQIEYIAEQALRNPDGCISYLHDDRGIDESVIRQCISQRTLGFSDYTNPKYKSGEKYYGGPAAAFIIQDFYNKRTKSVAFRYFDPDLNGGMKSKTKGERAGSIWIPQPSAFKDKHCHTVVLVESPINALSVLSAKLPGTTAIAMCGGYQHNTDWNFLRGKFVVLCMDNDLPNEKGHRPGPEFAWKLHSDLTEHDVPAMMVDQLEELWEDINDINDMLREKGTDGVRSAIRSLEPWLIPGLPGKVDMESPIAAARKRLYLPAHDWAVYWSYRVKRDFVTKMTIKNTEDGEKKVFDDVCGFRVAQLSRITVASASATFTGEADSAPTLLFCAVVQAGRHFNGLIRKVFTDEQLHNIDRWKTFGPVFAPRHFSRMLSILERSVEISGRHATNFVGLAWRDRKPVVNEGKDCFFTEPDKQCPYHNLSFPRGRQDDARIVLEAYGRTFRENAARMLLVWALGGHLKTFLGFWPHCTMQASKGVGKSTLVKKLERTIAFTMFSGQNLQTEYRLVTSIAHTSHPVGWEEISARRQETIDKAQALLQESYQYAINRRGSEMTEYLICAPVLLAGEDVPVSELQGKLVRISLSGKQGEMLSEDLVRFPVYNWLQYLTDLRKPAVKEQFQKSLKFCRDHSAASLDKKDDGAGRMIENYAAVLCAWKLVCDFAGMDPMQDRFADDLVREMNHHVMESETHRMPWVRILEVVLGQIDSELYRFPYKFEEHPEHGMVLYIRCTHMMQHLSQNNSLKAKHDSFTIKSPSVLEQQIRDAEVLIGRDVEKKINRKRVARLQMLSVQKMNDFGLAVSMPELLEVA